MRSEGGKPSAWVRQRTTERFALGISSLPSLRVKVCTQTRRSVSTAGTSRSQEGALGAMTAASSTCPSCPTRSANARRAASPRGTWMSSARRA